MDLGLMYHVSSAYIDGLIAPKVYRLCLQTIACFSPTGGKIFSA